MSDRLAMFRAILDNPADDTARLVFADWLEEHGTTDADRARVELVRLWFRLKPNLRSTTRTLALWLKANWARLWPSVAAAADLGRSRVRVQGRTVAANLRWPGERAEAELRVRIDRGFAESVQFDWAAGYLRFRAPIAADEPVATHEPGYNGHLRGVLPDATTVVYVQDWGPEVFARLADFAAEPEPGVKEYVSDYQLPVRDAYSPQRARHDVVRAMTAIARESNGLATWGRG
jgi:uncharacterized protein (TIGR02996 family)